TPVIVENVSTGVRAQSSTAVTYQWFLEGNAVTTAVTDSFYNPTETGNYTVEITDANGCKATSSPLYYVYLSVDNINTEVSFTVMPNPAKSEVLISTNLNKGFNANIYSLTGVEIATYAATTNTLQVNVDALQNGIYFIRITTRNGQTMTRRLIVE
ncbi:MAG TPA: T9SS type A sorting domain-containing protein, partial [Chitinophagales bacterium]|nr:T9SS type A sorting domain-containing protein [Chitinophagales bacterium]